MRSLRYAGPGDDGSSVVVEAEDGERFSLYIGDDLRAAVSPPPAPSPRRASASSGIPLTPREIQVRVRAGESAEDLAADSGSSLERVMRFAFPVLEERNRVGDEARRSRARRDGDGALIPFGETVDRRLAAHGVDPQSVGWDSYRRADGTWLVIAMWPNGDTERQAHWAFSLTARTVLPADEAAADLLSERPLRPVVQAVSEPSEESTTMPPPVEEVYDQEAGTYRRPPVAVARIPDGPPADPAATPPATERPFDDPAGRAPSPAERHEPATIDHDTPPLPLRLADAPPEDYPDDVGVDIIDVGAIDETIDAEPARPPTRRGGGRGKAAREQTRIPSWDDILLGVRRKND